MLGGEEEKDPDAAKKEEERQEALRQQEEERKAKHARMEAEREKVRQTIRDKVSVGVVTHYLLLFSKVMHKLEKLLHYCMLLELQHTEIT